MKIAINGLGRIGRNTLRSLINSQYNQQFEVVAINDLTNVETLAHLLRYDSTHREFNHKVEVADGNILVGNHQIKIFSERNPADLPWGDLAVDCVFECSGIFTNREKAGLHLKAGAKKVLISAPSSDVDFVAVFGVNHKQINANMEIISNASCTTNCLAPLVSVMHNNIGVKRGLVNTTHSYTNDQSLIDAPHSDLRRARAAAVSMVPSKTGAAKMIGKVIPELDNKLDGLAIRVPTANVSIVDFTFSAERETTAAEVNQLLKDAANGELKGVLCATETPLVSSDYIGNTYSSIADLPLTYVVGDLVKIMSWYDNEWGYSNRMLDVANHWLNL